MARKQNGFDLAKNMFGSSCSNEEVEKKFEHYMFTFQDELDNNIHITYRVSQQVFIKQLLIFWHENSNFFTINNAQR